METGELETYECDDAQKLAAILTGKPRRPAGGIGGR
jgi:hypothetical protein